MAREFCEAEGIEYVDLLSQFRGRNEEALWVHPTDQHPNHIGHQLMAEGIYEHFHKTGLGVDPR